MKKMETIHNLIRFFLIGTLSIAGIIFTMQNSQSVRVKFVYWIAPESPLAMVLLLAFAVGALVAGFYFLIDVFKMKTQLRKSRKMIELLEREVDALRNQPLYDEPPSPNSAIPNSLEQRLTHEGQPEISIELAPSKKTG